MSSISSTVNCFSVIQSHLLSGLTVYISAQYSIVSIIDWKLIRNISFISHRLSPPFPPSLFLFSLQMHQDQQVSVSNFELHSLIQQWVYTHQGFHLPTYPTDWEYLHLFQKGYQ